MRIPPIATLWTTLLIGFIGLTSTPATGAQSQEDVWRMAGTMNDWNATDEAWTLAPSRGEIALERELEPGTFRFKFVRNGDWDDAHFGGAGDGTLEQPGRDLVLDIKARGMYRIVLDPSARAWSWSPVRVFDPKLRAIVRGVPTAEQTFQIDFSRSLPSEAGSRPKIEAKTIAGEAEIQPIGADGWTLLVTPEDAGRLSIEFTMDDPAGRLSDRLDIGVSEGWSFHASFDGPTSSFDRRLPMDPAEPGVWRGLIWLRAPGTLRDLRVFRGDAVMASMGEPVAIDAGKYVVEVRDGVVTRLDAASALPDFLLPGEWTEFTYTPTGGLPAPERVYLSGTFNRWAGANAADTMEMASVATGSFRTLVDLSVGEHRYGYLLDGDRFVPDANNPVSVRDASEELVSQIVVGPRPGDFPLPRPNDLNLDALRHDPSQLSSLTPISRELGLADVSFITLPDDARGASVIVDVKQDDGSVERVRVACRKVRDGAGFDRYTARVMSNMPTLTYAIALSDGTASYVSEKYTVELPADPLMIPDWAKGAVWYQIFTERFRNGNPLNDPNGPGTYPMPWTADWYEVSEEEREAHRLRNGRGVNEPLEEITGGELFHVVWDRRYGGDLQGVVEKLDYLQDLGVTAIYFNPVFEGSSMHKYDTTSYRHIDDNFGRPAEAGPPPARFEWPTDPRVRTDDPRRDVWTASDRYFIDVVLPEARRRGIRVVIDGVFNHTGRDHFAFQDVMKNGNRSRFADWFFTEYADDGSLESWRAWDGPSGWLPKFRQEADRDLIEPVKRHIFAITERWMDPNGDGDPSDGIDGWRLDVPLDVGLPFWEEWRELVKTTNPEAVIIAEIWGDATETLRGDHFDTQMHYPFAMAVLDWLGVRPETRSDELVRRLEAAYDEAAQTLLIHQNLYASHDTDRYVSMLFNPGRKYDQGNRIQDGDAYRDTRPDERTYELSLLGVAIQATYMGAPMVYYGDELGMWGADDPTNRKPMPWPDMGPLENADDAADLGIHRVYRKWLRLRQDPVIGPVLRFGDIEHLDSGSPDLFAFQRSLNDVTVRVVVNRSDRALTTRRLNREGLGPDRIEARSAVYWVIDHEALATP